MVEPSLEFIAQLLRQMQADQRDLKDSITVLTGIMLGLEGRDSGLPIELAGVRQQIASLQRRVERLEAVSRPAP